MGCSGKSCVFRVFITGGSFQSSQPVLNCRSTRRNNGAAVIGFGDTISSSPWSSITWPAVGCLRYRPYYKPWMSPELGIIKHPTKISHPLGWNRKLTETSHRFITGFPGMSGTTQPHRFGCHLGEKRQIAPNIGNPWFNVGNSSKLASPWNTMLLM